MNTSMKRLTRNYERVDRYLDHFLGDVYAQPPDPGHTGFARAAIRSLGNTPADAETVLDVGCGQGFCQPMWEEIGYEWTGVTLGEDYAVCKEAGLDVHRMDMTFLDFPDNSFDLLFARHVLEHSPMPAVTLMEWHRVANPWMALVSPSVEHFTYRGQNHYSVMALEHLKVLLETTGWDVMHTRELKSDHSLVQKYMPVVSNVKGAPIPIEYWLFCRAKDPSE